MKNRKVKIVTTKNGLREGSCGRVKKTPSLGKTAGGFLQILFIRIMTTERYDRDYLFLFVNTKYEAVLFVNAPRPVAEHVAFKRFGFDNSRLLIKFHRFQQLADFVHGFPVTRFFPLLNVA